MDRLQLLLLFSLSFVVFSTVGAGMCDSGDFNLSLEESHTKLRNLLRAELRWQRASFGEDFLRERGELEFLCYESRETFALFFQRVKSEVNS